MNFIAFGGGKKQVNFLTQTMLHYPFRRQANLK